MDLLGRGRVRVFAYVHMGESGKMLLNGGKVTIAEFRNTIKHKSEILIWDILRLTHIL